MFKKVFTQNTPKTHLCNSISKNNLSFEFIIPDTNETPPFCTNVMSYNFSFVNTSTCVGDLVTGH